MNGVMLKMNGMQMLMIKKKIQIKITTKEITILIRIMDGTQITIIM